MRVNTEDAVESALLEVVVVVVSVMEEDEQFVVGGLLVASSVDDKYSILLYGCDIFVSRRLSIHFIYIIKGRTGGIWVAKQERVRRGIQRGIAGKNKLTSNLWPCFELLL